MTFLLFLPVPLALRRALRCPAPRSPLASRSPRSLAARAAALARHRERRGRGAGLPGAQPAESGKKFLRERRAGRRTRRWPGGRDARASGAWRKSGGRSPPGSRRARPLAPRRPPGGATAEPSRAASLLFPPRGAGWPSRRSPPPRAGAVRGSAAPTSPRARPAAAPAGAGAGDGTGRRGSRAEPRRAGWDSLLALASRSPARLLFFGRFSKKKKKSGSGF